ncbi:MAG: hypothetical protein M1838_001951 [Thelocarpon superellum]|nr:MAG: hypothetical protein M1838_001951 [Thelocarpon superellum]
MNPHIPFAVVVSWDQRNVDVFCPFCQQLHTHEFLGLKYGELNTRSSKCIGDSYSIRFPVHNTTLELSYEVDRSRGLFRTVGIQPSAQPLVDVTGLILEAGDNAVELGESVDPNLDDRRDEILVFQPHAFVVQTSTLSKILQRPGNLDRFIRNKDASLMSTLVILKTPKPEQVHVLLSREDALNHISDYTATPLISSTFPVVIDADELPKAVAMTHTSASQSGARRKPVQRRAPTGHMVMVPGTLQLTGQCNKARTIFGPFGPDNYQACRFFFNSMDYPPEDTRRAVAVLLRGAAFPLVSAISGWSDTQDVSVINGAYWTDRVLKISEWISHDLPRTFKDNGQDGRHGANHVEKQLIAWYLDHHTFSCLGSNTDGSLAGLSDIQPQQPARRVIVFISKPPCNNCLAFRDLVQKILLAFSGAEIRFRWGQPSRLSSTKTIQCER